MTAPVNYTSSARRRGTRRPRPARYKVGGAGGVSMPSATISARAVPPWATATVSRLQRVVPVAHPRPAPRRSSRRPAADGPFVELAAGITARDARPRISASVKPFPVAEADLAQAIVERVVAGGSSARAAHEIPWSAAPAERACDIGEDRHGLAVARKQIAPGCRRPARPARGRARSAGCRCAP